jgi:predicted ATPase
MEAEIYVPLFLGAVAQGYGQGGQAEEGLAVIAEALAMAEKNGGRWNEAELYRLKGELLLNAERGRQNDERQPQEEQREKAPVPHSSFFIHRSEDVEGCFLKAIEVARQQHAKSWELRAAISLARLWQQQGKTTEARDLLAPVYEWFTEGFDTADLKDAKALLDELS